jgi:hypothetical protein
LERRQTTRLHGSTSQKTVIFENFSLHHDVQTGCGAHPAFRNGYRVSFMVVQIVELLIMRFFPAFCHFIPPGSLFSYCADAAR